MEKNWLKYFKYSRLKNLIHVLLYTSFYQSSLIITIEKAMPTFQTMENSLKKIKFSWKYLYTCILFIVYQFYRWYQNNICHLKQAKQIFPYWQSSNFHSFEEHKWCFVSQIIEIFFKNRIHNMIKFFISDKHLYLKSNHYPDGMSHIIHDSSVFKSWFKI